VDVTLIQAWTSHKSFVSKDDSDGDQGGGSFKMRTRSNETHKSDTDADAKLYCKGKTNSELRFMGLTLSDIRYGLIVKAVVTRGDSYAEREAAKVMIDDVRQALPGMQNAITPGADNGCDAQEFIEACLWMGTTPDMAKNISGAARLCMKTMSRPIAMPSQNKRENLMSKALAGAEPGTRIAR